MSRATRIISLMKVTNQIIAPKSLKITKPKKLTSVEILKCQELKEKLIKFNIDFIF